LGVLSSSLMSSVEEGSNSSSLCSRGIAKIF
jgi:hypothetical protein